MCDSNDTMSSGVVCVISRQAGAVAGSSVAISKKIVGCGVWPIVAVKDCLGRGIKSFVPARDKRSVVVSDTPTVESISKPETERKKAAKALIAALESDLSSAQRDLEKARSTAENTHSKLASQLVELKEEKEILISDQELAKGNANEASFREGEMKMRVTALEADLTSAQRQLVESRKEKEDAKSQQSSNVSYVQAEKATILSDQSAEDNIEVASTKKKVKKPLFRKVVETEIPASAALTTEEIQATVFANPTDKIIFMRAFTDIGNNDAAVRVDAVKTLAGVHPELSVKVLARQMDGESSVKVRQECIKALASMELPGALSAIEQALDDEAGSVRLAAVWGVYHLAGVESATALIQMLADDDEEIQRRTAICIGWLGKEELAVELLPLLDNNSISVRQAAVEAMGNLRSRQVVSSLIERLDDPSESIKKVVLSALETITGKKMSKSFSKDQKEFKRLIARWQQWHQGQLSG